MRATGSTLRFLDRCQKGQISWRNMARSDKPERIGDFLVKIGAMTPEQVKAVLQIQELGDKRRFGEIAHLIGYIKDDAIKRYLDYIEKHEKT